MPYADREKRLAYHKKYNEQHYKDYYLANRDVLLGKTADYRKANLGKGATQAREYRRKLKQEAIAAYGGKCAICGEAHVECLTLDHSRRDGAAWRKGLAEMKNREGVKERKHGQMSGYFFYKFLRANGFPQDLGLRVLCWNCNCSIGAYGYSPLGTGQEV